MKYASSHFGIGISPLSYSRPHIRHCPVPPSTHIHIHFYMMEFSLSQMIQPISYFVFLYSIFVLVFKIQTIPIVPYYILKLFCVTSLNHLLLSWLSSLYASPFRLQHTMKSNLNFILWCVRISTNIVLTTWRWWFCFVFDNDRTKENQIKNDVLLKCLSKCSIRFFCHQQSKNYLLKISNVSWHSMLTRFVLH